MNRWQQIYCNTYYNGKLPKTNKGKAEYEMLGPIKEAIIVNFPDGPKTLIVTEDDCNIPEGRISVRVLARWLDIGYKIQTLDTVQERDCRIS